VLQDARALTQQLDRAHACARSAEQILGEDDPRRLVRLAARDGGDEAALRRLADEDRR